MLLLVLKELRQNTSYSIHISKARAIVKSILVLSAVTLRYICAIIFRIRIYFLCVSFRLSLSFVFTVYYCVRIKTHLLS
jgi:hypothetical protein